MALPNTSTPGGVSSSTTPNAPVGPQQVFQNPNSLVKQNSQTQKIEEILTNISSRLGNITNIRTQAQSAVYDAFGNNFLTRGATQITDSIADSIESVFAKKEQHKEDPIAKALKEQSKVLEKLSTAIGTKSESNQNFDELIELTKNAEETRQQVVTRLEKISVENHDFYNTNITLLEEQKKVADQHLELLKSLSNKSSRRRKKITDDTESTQASPVNDAQIIDFETPDEDLVAMKQETVTSPVEEKKEEQREVKQVTLLEKIAASMIDTTKLLKQFVSSAPLSTQESDLESYRDKNVVTDVVDGQKAPKPNKWKRILDGATDVDANAMGFMKMVGAVVLGLTTVIKFFTSGPMKALLAVLTAFGSILPGLGGGPKLPVPVPSGTPPAPVPSSPKPQTPPVPSKPGKAAKIGRAMSKGVLPVIIAALAMAGIDEGLGALGVGDNQVNSVQDASNWDRMSALQKAESGIVRGIEHVGDFVGLDNVANEARVARIEKETSYLDEQMRQISETQRDIEQENRRFLNRANAAAQETSKNTVINNSTYVPVRTPVKNTDDSFNRYLNSVLQ